MALTKEEVLRAVASAKEPNSYRINEEIARAHARRVRAGGGGHTPRTDLVLRRLRSLERDGLLKASAFSYGYYGYGWDITEAGRAALAQSKGGEDGR